MELDEMKNLWDTMSKDIEKQKILTDKLIIQMTEQQYKSSLQKIIIPEVGGAIICFATVILLCINFYKLETWYQIISGIILILILLLWPIISLIAVKKINNVNIAHNNYKQTIIDYNKGKRLFSIYLKSGYYLGFALMILALPAGLKIIGDKDIFLDIKGWSIIPSMLLSSFFFFLFCKWIFKYYKKTIAKAGNILKDLEN